MKLKKIFFSNNEIALNHGYEDSFNQSLQNALFNLSKTGQRDQNSTTHLNSSRLEIPLDIKVCSVFYSLFLCLSLFVCVVHRTSSLPGDFMTTQHFKDINHQTMILTSSAPLCSSWSKSCYGVYPVHHPVIRSELCCRACHRRSSSWFHNITTF